MKIFIVMFVYSSFLPGGWGVGRKKKGKKPPQQNKNLRKSEKLKMLIKYILTLVSHGRYVIQVLYVNSNVNLKVSTLVLYMCTILA